MRGNDVMTLEKESTGVLKMVKRCCLHQACETWSEPMKSKAGAVLGLHG